MTGGFSRKILICPKMINVSHFLHGDSYQGKILSKIKTVGWLSPGIPNHAQVCLNFLWGDFGVATLKIIQYRRLTEF